MVSPRPSFAVRLIENEALTLESVTGFLRGVQRLLEKVHAVHSDQPIVWGLKTISKRSPLRAVLEPVDPSQRDAAEETTRIAFNGMVALSRHTEPDGFDDPSIRAAKQIVETLGRPDVSTAEIRFGRKKVELTYSMRDEIAEVLRDPSRYIFADDTSLVGWLDDALGHQGNVFVLYDDVDEFDIKCTFPDDLWTAGTRLLKKRVVVSGRVKYERASGRPLTIDASEIEPFGGDDFDLSELPDLDLTGDLDSVEFVRRSRDA